MDSNQQGGTGGGGDQGGSSAGMPGYHTPGQDTTIESSSPAVKAPGMTGEQRMEDPKPVIQAIHETPGDANPALAETIGEEQGRVSTADLLLARETAEERPIPSSTVPKYEDQAPGARPDEFQDADSGRPNWPDDRREDPLEYMESPRADAPLGAGSSDVFGPGFKGRVDSVVDIAATQASAGESHSGLAPVGHDMEEDKYEHREFGRPEPPSDMDMIAPGMVNLPPDDDNG